MKPAASNERFKSGILQLKGADAAEKRRVGRHQRTFSTRSRRSVISSIA